MTFSNVRGQINPVVSYYYDTGARQRFTTWHVLAMFITLALAMTLFFARTVTSNLQLITAEPALLGAQTPTPVPVANSVSSIPHTDELQADIDTWISAHKGVDWSVSVEAIDGGLSAGVHAEETFTLASLYKLFLLQPLVQKVPSNTWETATIAGKSYKTCVDAMIRVSDNACAEAIGSSLGWSKAETYLRSLGYAKTAFVGSTTTGTAQETAALLKNLYTGEGFDDLTRSSALSAMLATKKTEAIRRGCDGCTVYNKTGDLAGFHNDAAIVEKNGKAYTIVIFSKTGSWQQMAELTKVIAAHL